MSRPLKPGLEYFPFDVDFFQDIKVRKLIKYQSGKALPIYTHLLCNIYKNGYYLKWDKELPFVISEVLGYEEGYINEVIKCCLNIDLFSKEMFETNNVLTSKGIQERYNKVQVKSKKTSIVSEFTCISTEEIAVTTEVIKVDTESSTQSKVKKSKVKKEGINPPTIEEVKLYFDEYGYSTLKAEEAYKMYSNLGWHDTHGKRITSWKGKMQSVWFKTGNEKQREVKNSDTAKF